jgi:hypothetical protein
VESILDEEAAPSETTDGLEIDGDAAATQSHQTGETMPAENSAVVNQTVNESAGPETEQTDSREAATDQASFLSKERIQAAQA